MTNIYTTKPENRAGYLLLLMSIILIAFLAFIIFEDALLLFSMKKNSDIAITVTLFFIIGGWLFYNLDEAIWQLFGKEQCAYTEKEIIVTKNRLIKREKKIAWNEISRISTYTPPAIWKTITYFTATGLPQEKILIVFKKGKKYKCGVNLNKYQTMKVIEDLNSMLKEKRFESALSTFRAVVN